MTTVISLEKSGKLGKLWFSEQGVWMWYLGWWRHTFGMKPSSQLDGVAVSLMVYAVRKCMKSRDRCLFYVPRNEFCGSRCCVVYDVRLVREGRSEVQLGGQRSGFRRPRLAYRVDIQQRASFSGGI